MFTRIVECKAKPGMCEEAAKIVRLELLPALQKQAGFIDFIVLRDHDYSSRIVCISFWETKNSAERYDREDAIVHSLRLVLETEPGVKILRVDVSTPHQIAGSRAA
jgi:quinol monooxygenase YgiN